MECTFLSHGTAIILMVFLVVFWEKATRRTRPFSGPPSSTLSKYVDANYVNQCKSESMTGHSPLDTVHSLPVTQAYFSLPRHSIVCLVVWSSSSLSLSRLVRGFAVVHLYTVHCVVLYRSLDDSKDKQACPRCQWCVYVCVCGRCYPRVRCCREGRETENGKRKNRKRGRML